MTLVFKELFRFLGGDIAVDGDLIINRLSSISNLILKLDHLCIQYSAQTI